MSDEEQSEFGKGFTYCIGLFLAHHDRIAKDLEAYKGIGNEDSAYEMWFNAAADHLYDLQTPEAFSLKTECEEWQKKCINWRLCMKGDKCGKKEFEWAIRSAKDFLLAWDKQCGIETEQGRWE